MSHDADDISYNLINESDFFGGGGGRGNVPTITHLPLNSIFRYFLTADVTIFK
jgi:hypothetical protein